MILILGFGLILAGCKKETPPPKETITPPTPAQDETAKEKENVNDTLSDPNVVICSLNQTTLSKLDLPENHMISFIYRMRHENKEELKEGRISLANRPFEILLGQKPEEEFHLCDIEKKFGPFWWGSWNLYSYHKIDEMYYQFSLLEEGTKLAARPYKGPLGLFRIGKGNRQIEKVEATGSLRQATNIYVPVGIVSKGWPEPVTECIVPAGDYLPYVMNVTYDNLHIYATENNHTNTQDQSNRDKQTVYGISIREDQPYVLNFSNKPVVVFDEPGEDKITFPRGQEIKFAAVLVDPKLDIIIRRLYDTSEKVEREHKDTDGKVIRRMKVNKPLDPKVVITRADGQTVAEGVMPFGKAVTCGYTWRVPDDLKITGDEEEFTVTVTYETQKLYGEVTSQRKITIRN